MDRILIIQTAFIRDVILATPIIEKLHQHYPDAKIDFLVRRGNGGLLKGHPYLNNVFIWKKKQNKYGSLIRLIYLIRSKKYDTVINVQRYFASGLLTALSGAKLKIGFRKNPMSFMFDKKVSHKLNGQHETSRNLSLIKDITDKKYVRPKLYPRKEDYEAIKKYQKMPYLCIAPTSVWASKQFPTLKWAELIFAQDDNWVIYLLGGPTDYEACQELLEMCERNKLFNLAGKLHFLASAALMNGAAMNYVNDSAPLHMASAMNSPVNAVFCSTVPSFGFGPLSLNSKVVEIKEQLHCRPCGVVGKKECPLGHFNCAHEIKIKQFDLPAYPKVRNKNYIF